MATKRRAVIPVLSFQVACLVVLSVLAALWVWRAADTRGAVVRAPRQAIESVRASANTAIVAPYAYLHSKDQQHLADMQQAVSNAQAQVEALRLLVPTARASLDRADLALQQVTANAGMVYNAPPEADLSGAVEEMEMARVALEASLRDLESTVERRAQRHYQDATDGLLIIWVLALIVTLATTLAARRRAASNNVLQEKETKKLVENVGSALRRSATGTDEGRSPDFVEPETYAALTDAAEAAIAEVHRLRALNSRISKSSSFIQDLVDGLAMAETSDEVIRTGVRAARMAYPDSRFQFVLVDDESGAMVAHDEEVAQACDARDIEQCPAIRKGRTIHHLTEDGFSRCPRLRTDEHCVTCALVQVAGRNVAVSQLIDYVPEHTQFEDIEALGLAIGSRLGVVRELETRVLAAGTDQLTKLVNRRLLLDRLERLDRTESPYTVVVADIDDFTALNEEHGQEAGDKCLQIFADVMREACRGSDLPARMGGEEFVILLPSVGIRAGLSVAMRTRAYLAEACRKAPADFTVSIGVACRPAHGSSSESVLRAADEALHTAKESGKDQVVPARIQSTFDDII